MPSKNLAVCFRLDEEDLEKFLALQDFTKEGTNALMRRLLREEYARVKSPETQPESEEEAQSEPGVISPFPTRFVEYEDPVKHTGWSAHARRRK